MKKFSKQPLTTRIGIYLLAIAMPFVSISANEDFSNRGTGFIEPTKEELQDIKQHSKRVQKVHLNNLGRSRIIEHRKQQGMPVDDVPEAIAAGATEIETSIGDTVSTKLGASGTGEAGGIAPPPFVDNSKLPSFPPIGDQGGLNTCVAWSTTYYQATHEIGLLNGYNNKTLTNHILSPKWIYDLLNRGVDGGIPCQGAYALLAQSGAVTIDLFPYDANYTTWDLQPNDWISAMNNRTVQMQTIQGLDGDPNSLQLIKGLLNNGHVVTFGTYAGSWVQTRVLRDPKNLDNLHFSDFAIKYMKGTSGAHFVTIVGYDDNLWIDVNGNGVEDPGERGAFLIANSWGTAYASKGFIWISYDAFLAQTAVPNFMATRIPIAAASGSIAFSITPKAQNYTPQLVSQFSYSGNIRSNFLAQAGLSDTTTTTPSLVSEAALNNTGGNYNFDGTTNPAPETATFSLDLTDLLSSDPTTNMQRFYLVLQNLNSAGNTLNSYSLLDLTKNIQIHLPGLPLAFDKGTMYSYIDYNFLSGTTWQEPANDPVFIPKDITPPSISITSPKNNQILSGTVNVSASVTDPSGINYVKIFVDATLIASFTTGPYSVLLDTTTLTNSSHSITVMSADIYLNQSASTIHVKVSN